MRPRIRILYPEKKRSFSDLVETKARQLARRLDSGSWEASPVSTLEREITLTVQHIDNARALYTACREDLVGLECYLKSRLLQLNPGRPVHLEYLFVKHDKLKLQELTRLREKLLAVEVERKRLPSALEDKLQPLRSELLRLLNRHSLVSPENGN